MLIHDFDIKIFGKDKLVVINAYAPTEDSVKNSFYDVLDQLVLDQLSNYEVSPGEF